MQPLALILVILAGAAVTVPLARLRRGRRRRLAALALRRGWTYSPDDPWNLPAKLASTLLGSFGHDRQANDVFTVPTSGGVLWLADFSRQMAAGRRRRTERFALVVATCRDIFGGIAVLPAEGAFTPAGAFSRYRRVELSNRGLAPGVSAWADRPTSERNLILDLAEKVGRLGRSAAAEVRGQLAIIYWPMDRSSSERTYVELAEAGRQLLDLLARASTDTPHSASLIPRAGPENP